MPAVSTVDFAPLRADQLGSFTDARAGSMRSQPAKLLGLRILLAEDGVENQRFVAWVLRRAGAHVQVASDGLDALNLMQHAASEGYGFDLIVTDIEMPRMDGVDLVRRLRRDGVRVPILALTALTDVQTRERSVAAGCNSFLSKPITPAELLEACTSWLHIA